MSMTYPPEFQDKATLAQNICMGETTIDEYVAAGLLPPPRHGKDGGKLLWIWSEVCEAIRAWPVAGKMNAQKSATVTNFNRADRVRNATESASRATSS
jgi:hypothetical protein